MIKKNYKIKPKNFENKILEFINANPHGVSGQDVAKKFNLMPHMAGKTLRILYRHGIIDANKSYGLKDSWTLFYPISNRGDAELIKH